MIRTLWVFLFAGMLFCTPALGDSFELKRKKIKMNKNNADVLPTLELRPENLTELSKEPKYKSDYPQKFVTHFGPEGAIAVSMSVDEKRGSGKGFDYLYADVNGSGDLSKGKRVAGKTSTRGYSYMDTEFAVFEVEIPDGEGAVTKFPVQARFSIKREATNDSSLYLTSLCILEGSLSFGESKRKVMVFDTNCNGVFGDTASGGGRGGENTGDRIWIGTGSPKVEDAYVEALPLGKYYLFENQYYEINFTEKQALEVAEADVAVGLIRVNNPGFLLELNKDNTVLYVSNEEGQEVNVPVGSYKVNTSSFRMKHKGKTWELEGEPGNCSQSFTVEEGQTTEVSIGPPLKIMVTANLRVVGNGRVASLDFHIAGADGEKYKYLREGGKKVDLPDISIRNGRNKEVEKGAFEYG
jgi:hypothetical protein